MTIETEIKLRKGRLYNLPQERRICRYFGRDGEDYNNFVNFITFEGALVAMVILARGENVKQKNSRFAFHSIDGNIRYLDVRFLDKELIDNYSNLLEKNLAFQRGIK